MLWGGCECDGNGVEFGAKIQKCVQKIVKILRVCVKVFCRLLSTKIMTVFCWWQAEFITDPVSLLRLLLNFYNMAYFSSAECGIVL